MALYSMNERGAITIDHEFREIHEIENKEALLRLRDIQVRSVSDDLSLRELPDETCQTISRINKRGTVVIDWEVRHLLGIDGNRAMIEIGEIEVSRVLEETTEVHTSLTPHSVIDFYTRAAVSWGKTKDTILRLNPEFEYPPTKSTAAKIVGSGGLIATIAAILLTIDGSLTSLAAGDPVEWAGLTIAIIIGMILMAVSLPNRGETVEILNGSREA